MLRSNMGADQSNNQLPVVGVGAIVVHDGRVLLVKRGKPPNAGEWAIPGGKLKWGESLQQGAERETLEETGITIAAGEMCYHFEHIVPAQDGAPEFHYVVLDFRGEYVSGSPKAADDAADARWISLDELASINLNQTTRRALIKLHLELK